jgi:hypothetical protein
MTDASPPLDDADELGAVVLGDGVALVVAVGGGDDVGVSLGIGAVALVMAELFAGGDEVAAEPSVALVQPLSVSTEMPAAAHNTARARNSNTTVDTFALSRMKRRKITIENVTVGTRVNY